MQRAQASESGPFEAEIEHRESQFERDVEAREEARHAPEHRGDDAPADRIVIIAARILGRADDAARDGAIVGPAEADPQADEGRERDDAHMDGEAGVRCSGHAGDRNEQDREPDTGPRQNRFHEPSL